LARRQWHTIDYEQVALRIRALAAAQHYRLVETFADRIASSSPSTSARRGKGKRGEDRILPNAKFVGVTLELGKR